MTEIMEIASLINNKTNKRYRYTVINKSIMDDFDNLPSNLIKILGNDFDIYQKDIDIYNKDVFSITNIKNNYYYIIIPDIEEYGANYDKKMFIVVCHQSLNQYNEAINKYYSQFN